MLVDCESADRPARCRSIVHDDQPRAEAALDRDLGCRNPSDLVAEGFGRQAFEDRRGSPPADCPSRRAPRGMALDQLLHRDAHWPLHIARLLDRPECRRSWCGVARPPKPQTSAPRFRIAARCDRLDIVDRRRTAVEPDLAGKGGLRRGCPSCLRGLQESVSSRRCRRRRRDADRCRNRSRSAGVLADQPRRIGLLDRGLERCASV